LVEPGSALTVAHIEALTEAGGKMLIIASKMSTEDVATSER
jgi:hypothetical protein